MPWELKAGQKLAWSPDLNRSFRKFLSKKFGNGPFEILAIITEQNHASPGVELSEDNRRFLQRKLHKGQPFRLLAIRNGKGAALLSPELFTLLFDPNPQYPG